MMLSTKSPESCVVKVVHPDFPATYLRWRQGGFICTTTLLEEAKPFSDFEAEAEARFIRLLYVDGRKPIDVVPVKLQQVLAGDVDGPSSTRPVRSDRTAAQ